MIKNLICIECPKGCEIELELIDGKISKIVGNHCINGEKYAIKEIENPVRDLTTTIEAVGLSLKFVPVRTDKAIDKNKLYEVLKEIKKIKIDKPILAGDIIKENLLGLGVDLISTRNCS